MLSNLERLLEAFAGNAEIVLEACYLLNNVFARFCIIGSRAEGGARFRDAVEPVTTILSDELVFGGVLKRKSKRSIVLFERRFRNEGRRWRMRSPSYWRPLWSMSKRRLRSS